VARYRIRPGNAAGVIWRNVFTRRSLRNGGGVPFPIVSNHPFIDGNKRTGTVAALTFLDLNGYWFDKEDAPELDDALEALVLSVACGEAGKDAVAAFFRKHCGPTKHEA